MNSIKKALFIDRDGDVYKRQEVEPAIDDEIAIRRVEYYRRNGYKVLEKEYIQPSYHKREDACPLWIMGNENSDFLPQYIERIKDEVYRRNISE